jgi:uroporphyrinogen decarboxylase
MNARERFLSVFEDRIPDRVPRFVQGVKEDFIAKYEDELLGDFEGELTYNLHYDGPVALGFDACFAGVPRNHRCPGIDIEVEGKTYHVGLSGRYGDEATTFYQKGGITTLERHETVFATVEYFDASETIRQTADYFAQIDHQVFSVPMLGGLFDDIWMAMGMSTFAREYRKNSKFYQAMIRDRAELILRHVEAIIEATKNRFGILSILDDVAFKGRLMISPQRWREDFGKYYREINKLIHDAGMHAMIHTDGDVTDLVPELIDVGFEGLQGWEGGADPHVIKERFPEFVVIGFGDVSEVLPFGSTEEVDQHVRELMDVLKPGGRYVFGPSTVIVKEMPYENVKAFMAAADKYGLY